MKVYHGSDMRITRIDLQKCKPNRDFGKGFYVTNIRLQAEEMAVRVARRSAKMPVVTEFDFDEYAYEDEDLYVLRFDAYTEDWLDFVVLNRNKDKRTNVHTYDIVEGPVADDRITRRIILYQKGRIAKTQFLEELKHNVPTHQLCFCSMQSLQMLSIPDDEFVIDRQEISEAIIEKLISEKKIEYINACDLYFNSATYKNIEDKSTELYLLPWEKIYELILQELRLVEKI